MWSLGWSGGAWAEGDEAAFSSAAGSSTVAAVAVAITSAAGNAAGASTVTGGVTSPLAIGTSAVRQKIYHDPLETTAGGTLTTWGTNLTFAPADVNTSTDVIDLGATHNMIRGEGPWRLTTTDTLPAPLAIATDYYTIRDSATGIKLATTAQNAVAGTAVNLTATGVGTHTLVRAKSTPDGSAFLLMAALGTWSLTPEAPTDSHGNTYTARAGSPISYSAFPSARAGCWTTLGPGSNGGDGFTASKTWSDENPPATTSSDEPTIAWLEIKGAKFVKSATQLETAIGSATITSNNVEATAAAILVAVIFGNGPIGQDHTWTWGSGFTGIPECSATGNTSDNGYIQIAVAYKVVEVGGLYSFSASGVSNEGGQMYLFAFQSTDPTGSAAGTSTVDAPGTSVAASAGSASGTATVAGVAYQDGSTGDASGVGTATGVGTAIHSAAGSASGTSTPAAVGASTAGSAGSSSGTVTASAVGAATSASDGAASGTATPTATGAATSAGAGSSSGTATSAAIGAAVATGVGASSGTATVDAVGGAIAAGTGAAAGTATPAAAGAATADAAGAASGLASVAGTGTSVAAGVGSASGTGSAAASADAGVAAGSASGVASVAAASTAIHSSAGAASGAATVTASSNAITDAAGAASGASTPAGTGAATSAAAGAATGLGDAAGVAAAIVSAAGAAAGTSSAAAAAGAAAPLPHGLRATRTTATQPRLTRTTPPIALTRTTPQTQITRTT